MKFKEYHKIKQFKDVVKTIQHQANYKGLDENGEPIYEESLKPTITFIGTIKLHGTNAGICYNPINGMVAQKRSSFLKECDNINAHMGFYEFVNYTEKKSLLTLMQLLYEKHCKFPEEQLILYGEWAGTSIQKGVSISELPKAFYIFDCKIYDAKKDTNRWIDISNLDVSMIDNVYNIYNFPTYSLEIDFNNPGNSQNKLIELTNEVEKECPVAKQLGVSGIGEGIVWTGFYKGEKYIFKVKGEKHSTSKVKTLASVDPEVLNNIDSFVDYACTKNRIEQGIKEVNATEKKDMPDLLRWVAKDILEEEANELKANNLEWEQVAKDCNNRVRLYFFEKLNTL